jgi:hypothetical protein
MKAYHFIAPALTAVVGAIWIYQQQDTLTELEEKTRIVQERLQQFETAKSSATSSATTQSVGKLKDALTLADGTPDWKAIAELIAEAENSGGMPSHMKAMMKLQAKLMEMDESEIEDGFNKLATLDLTEDVAQQLKQALIQMLAQKNPEKALDLMGDIITSRENRFHWVQQSAFRNFATKDPAGALAWLDGQVKSGKFVSKALDPGENPRLRFESALLGSLLESDLPTVQARLSTFSEEERKQLFSDPNQWKRGGKMPVEFLELARKNLDSEQATDAIAEAWSGRHNTDLKGISESLNEVSFSDLEHDAIVKKSISNFLQNGSDDENNHKVAYEWAQEQSPKNAGPLIAQSLATQGLWGDQLETNFQKALDLTETFQAPSIAREFASLYIQNDDVLKARLDNFKDPALAEKMKAIYQTLPKDSE